MDNEDIDRMGYRLEMKGYLNGYTGEGSGKYDMDCTFYLKNGDVVSGKFDCKWKLKKLSIN